MIHAARLVQVLGLLLALAGLLGYAFFHDPLSTPLSTAEAALINPSGETFTASFVIAGRDIEYTAWAGPPIYDRQGRVIGRTYEAQSSAYGTNTDTIFYVQIVGSKVYLVAIPRDIWLADHQIKINATIMYPHLGADGLRREVSKLLGVPIDYYAIINIDIFERLVDALGGVEVHIPQVMKYDDFAAGLHIDFQPGPRHLNGQEAAGFVRYRSTLEGGDLGRIDNIKRLATAMLARARQVNVGLVGAFPELMSTLFEEVETNADPAIVTQLLSRVSQFEIIAATLPVHDQTVAYNDSRLGRINIYTQAINNREVETFLAQTFGGEARLFDTVPDADILVSNRSGQAGLEDAIKTRLIRSGVPEARISTQELGPDPLPTRLQAERDGWQASEYYANLLNLERAQVFRINRASGSRARLELVLGPDATLLLAPLEQAQTLGGQNNRTQ